MSTGAIVVLLAFATAIYIIVAGNVYATKREVSRAGAKRWDADEAAVAALLWPKYMVRAIGKGWSKLAARDQGLD